MGNEGRVVRRDNGGIGRQFNDKDGIIEGRRGSQWSHLIVEIQWMGLLRCQIFTKVRLLFNSFRNLALINFICTWVAFIYRGADYDADNLL